MQKLPLGIQTFADMIPAQYVDVDQTRTILNLLQAGKYLCPGLPALRGRVSIAGVQGLMDRRSGGRWREKCRTRRVCRYSGDYRVQRNPTNPDLKEDDIGFRVACDVLT